MKRIKKPAMIAVAAILMSTTPIATQANWFTKACKAIYAWATSETNTNSGRIGLSRTGE